LSHLKSFQGGVVLDSGCLDIIIPLSDQLHKLRVTVRKSVWDTEASNRLILSSQNASKKCSYA
jgi:hypothetical protein